LARLGNPVVAEPVERFPGVKFGPVLATKTNPFVRQRKVRGQSRPALALSLWFMVIGYWFMVTG
jgi:hypothetical protein